MERMDNNLQQDIPCLETMALKAHLAGDLRRDILRGQDTHISNLRQDDTGPEAHNNRHRKVAVLDHRDLTGDVQCNHAVMFRTLTCR